MIRSHISILLCMVLLWVLATPALATDGVLEINQVCAVQTGCFAGDTPGFPVTIDGSEGKSYQLTSDLLISDANTTAVVIAADGVTFGLAGFGIEGPTACSTPPVSCGPTGVGVGVDAAAVEAVWIRNGRVQGMGSIGISVGARSRVENIVAIHNGFHGIELTGTAGMVIGCTVSRNGGRGMTLAIDTAYGANVVTENAAGPISRGVSISSNICDGNISTCATGDQIGAICNNDLDCLSGFCVDGVCCDAQCGSTCESCVTSATGATTGFCAFIMTGIDPDNECAGSLVCDGTGICNAECVPGSTEQQACGCGGTRSRICDAGGVWGQWSSCSGEVPPPCP